MKMREASLGLVRVAATAMLFSTLTIQWCSAEEGRAAAASSSVPETIMNLSSNENPTMKNDKERFIFSPHSTTTYTVVSATTSTAFFTCLSGTATDICGGRRKKRGLRITQDISERKEKSDNLSASLAEGADTTVTPAGGAKEAEGGSVGDEKLAITVWTTTRLTTSVTVTTTDTASTVRVSYFCLAGNIQLPPFPC